MEKRYYWLKLSDDFFGDKAIRKLRSIAGGDTYTIIYLKMLLLAVKQDNKLYYDGIEVSFSDEVALEIGEDGENVKMTMQYLMSKGLMEQINPEEIVLTQCEELVGSETDAARRKRISRSRQKVALLEVPKEEVEEMPEEEMPEAQTHEEPKPPKKKDQSKENCVQIYERIKGEYQLHPLLEDEVRIWLKYKMEKKEAYKEQGLRTLLKKVCKMSMVYSDEEIFSVFETSMENNWKGLFWDRLNEMKGKRQGNTYMDKIANRVSDVDEW